MLGNRIGNSLTGTDVPSCVAQIYCTVFGIASCYSLDSEVSIVICGWRKWGGGRLMGGWREIYG